MAAIADLIRYAGQVVGRTAVVQDFSCEEAQGRVRAPQALHHLLPELPGHSRPLRLQRNDAPEPLVSNIVWVPPRRALLCLRLCSLKDGFCSSIGCKNNVGVSFLFSGVADAQLTPRARLQLKPRLRNVIFFLEL
jgi:hypothetical protein